MKILYIDAENSGISGDMLLSGLLGLVNKPESIILNLEKLGEYLPGVNKLKIKLSKLKRSGIIVNKLNIDLKENKHHRNSKTLEQALINYLNDFNYSSKSKNYAIAVLNTLIEAEKEVHGNLSNSIHLHELSSVDTLIDIAGTSKILEELGAFDDDFLCITGVIPLGGGTINTAHGLLPVPAPATANILKKSNISVKLGPIKAELTTPTGAALISNLNIQQQEIDFNITNISYSTGQKVFDNFPNILRLLYGNKIESKSENNLSIDLNIKKEKIAVLETNIDDVSGEIIGHFIGELEKEDILDFQIINTITKKNRPGYLIKVYCDVDNKNQIIIKMLAELGTLGVRQILIDRFCVDRYEIKRDIQINEKKFSIQFKVSYITNSKGVKKIINIKPEYEDLKKISETLKLPLREIQFSANEICSRLFSEMNNKYNKIKEKK
ncbi:MAG: nickel pincer cofactor biosynthesis protein LarC [Promethearchaeota archaeon]